MQEEAARLYFDVFDVDHSGYIDMQEMRSVMSSLVLGGASNQDHREPDDESGDNV